MLTPHPIRRRRTNEELFFDYRSQIAGWASQLTHQDRADAEDLVQDFYIQVTSLNLPLAEVDEIEPYLFKILRNLHYSRLRQHGKSPIHDLSIEDYDSLERALVATDRHDLLAVHADLKQICEYACERKRTAIRASFFILRFFFGYYPSEVMKVALVSRAAVDRSLQLARQEAHDYLNRSNADGPLTHQERRNAASSAGANHSHALFFELQQIIFNSSEGQCIGLSALKKRYRVESPARFTVSELAHLVSCKHCLDTANTILGLPVLDERSPDDTIGRDNPPGPGSSDGPKLSFGKAPKRSDSTKERKALDRKRREIFEHRPTSLEVAVNGETRTSQRVTAEVSELHLKLNRTEALSFIEVFSEQGLRLAYLHVIEPTLNPNLEQREHIRLSDGRSLEITLSFANDLPTVHVVYRDLVFAQIAAMQDDDEVNILAAPAERWGLQRENDARHNTIISFPLRSWISSLKDRLPRISPPRMNPLFASAMLVALASVFCFFWLQSSPRMTATVFLDHAQTREASTAENVQPGVVFQKIRIKTPKRTSERTLYRDIQHRRRVKERGPDANDSGLQAKLAKAGVDWNDPLSAVGYRDWRSHEVIQSDSIKETGNDRLTLTTSVHDSEVLSESLTVRESDFHAVGKTVELRDYGTVEIAELNYDVLPWGAVNQDWFAPMEGHAVSDGPGALPVLPSRQLHLSHELQLETEVATRYALHGIGADLGEPVTVQTSALASAPVSVIGIVSSAARKQELLAALKGIPHVAAQLQTEEEAARRELHPSVTRAAPDVLTTHSPIEKELLEHFGDPVAAGNFSQRAVGITRDLMAHAWALRHLSERYPASGSRDELTLTPSSRQLLETMRRDHRRAMSDATSQLTTLLRPVLQPIVGASPEPTQKQSSFTGAQEVQRLTLQLLSGSESPSANDSSEPVKAAQDLLVALRGLQIALEEQQ